MDLQRPMHEDIIVVGSGILGLSLAEYFSRNPHNKVNLISNEHPQSGSWAAAANLATKGQLFARDPHFALKLQAKKIYSKWLTSLLKEADGHHFFTIDEIFKHGKGIDYFDSKQACDMHFKRVVQPQEELKKRNLPANPIFRTSEMSLEYHDEMWVDAKKLLLLLKKVLTNRGCSFYCSEFSFEMAEHIFKNTHVKHNAQETETLKKQKIIFCTGAWTRELLSQHRICEGNIFSLQPSRFTIGSTFTIENRAREYLKNGLQHYALLEFIDSKLKTKLTVSGSSKRFFLSSTTLKIQSHTPTTMQDIFFNPERVETLSGLVSVAAYSETYPA
ncbi:MAG: FAD-dependent oxidoreductase, partial [Silvanigrellaceae bacterium]|nr:FAD-dependent oxidoreductase [Silvanigrellaceae bacterium]